MATYRHGGAGRIRGPRHVYVPDMQHEQERVAARANIAALVFALAFLVAVLATALWMAPVG